MQFPKARLQVWRISFDIARYGRWLSCKPKCNPLGSNRYVILWHKAFRERQHPRSAEIRKCDQRLTVAISSSDPLHGTLFHATKFHAIMLITFHNMNHHPSDLVQANHGNFKVLWNAQKWPSMAFLYSDLLHGTVHNSNKFQADSWYP